MDESKIYDKLDEFRKDLATHERHDRDSHDEMSKDLTVLQGKMEGCTARLDAHSLSLESIQGDIKSILESIRKQEDPADIRKQISELKQKVTTLETEVDRNKEDRESRKEWRDFIIQRALWIIVPVLLAGFIAMMAEALGLVDMIDHRGETDHEEVRKLAG